MTRDAGTGIMGLSKLFTSLTPVIFNTTLESFVHRFGSNKQPQKYIFSKVYDPGSLILKAQENRLPSESSEYFLLDNLTKRTNSFILFNHTLFFVLPKPGRAVKPELAHLK